MVFLSRIRERKIVQWALAYLAVAWVIFTGLPILAEQFGIPNGITRGATVLLAAGFVAVLIVAWYHGERGDQSVSTIELLMLTTLAIATTGILWQNATGSSPRS